MTIALLACGAALLLWPAPRPAQQRLRWLADAARLARPRVSGVSARRWGAIATRPVAALAVMSIGLSATVWRGATVGIAAAVGVTVVAAGLARAAQRRAAWNSDEDLSAALRLLRAELDVGNGGESALMAAAAAAGGHRAAFEAAARAVGSGGDVVEAVSRAGGSADMMAVGRTWRLAHSLGVPVGDVLERLDTDLRDRRAQRRAVASVLAGPRSSAALLAGLPLLGVVLGAAMGAHPLAVLLETPVGQLMLCAGVLLDAAGVAWTARLITVAERP